MIQPINLNLAHEALRRDQSRLGKNLQVVHISKIRCVNAGGATLRHITGTHNLQVTMTLELVTLT